ncbi:hypothetical protein HMPREF0591_1387 [Mycobacterium parascrofulaceum ATCC BAA-614]|uniref:Uncharacterized protein n=1 Tax=Mycobacterium parascrofulaceum ATCC BAA-614 TaxID=525368 RepID=D5P5E3_9MYCO|nr:hypothetical protein HMPREF0591_1387 [Mycobacterium parascrofulaceum ATCC BAA-614]
MHSSFATAVCYANEHLVRSELRAAFRTVRRAVFFPPAPGLHKPHFCDGSGELKLKRLRRC